MSGPFFGFWGQLKRSYQNWGLDYQISSSVLLAILIASFVSVIVFFPFGISGALRVHMLSMITSSAAMLEYNADSANRWALRDETISVVAIPSTNNIIGFGLCSQDNSRYILPVGNPFDPDLVAIRYDYADSHFLNRVPRAAEILLADYGSLVLIENAFTNDKCNIDIYFRVDQFVMQGVKVLTLRLYAISFIQLVTTFLVLSFISRRVVNRSVAKSLGTHHPKQAYGLVQNRRIFGFAKLLSSRGQLIDEYFSEQARLASLGLATSKLTHDIRNLLSSLSLIAERLRQNDSDTDRATADRMSLTVSRALTLCDWAAQYSQDKQRNISIDRHNLFSIVEDVLTFAKQYDPRDQVQVTNSVSANMMVWCDKTLLFRILFNLSLNAVQAMQGQESRSFLKIAAARYKDHICIDVADGGPGMEPSDEDIFYAGSSYFSIKSRSTGLGLIIAQDLTRWLGGEVKILHTGPSGTVLRVAIRNIAPEPVESGGASDIVDYASVTDYKEPS